MRLIKITSGFEELIPEDETLELLDTMGISKMAWEMMQVGIAIRMPDKNGFKEYRLVDDDYFVCELCGNTGEVVTSEQVYPGEPHMADIGSRKCSHLLANQDDYDDQS